MSHNIKIAVFGTGGIGGFFGSRLAAAGVDVSFIARGDHLKSIQRDGLYLDSVAGDIHVNPVTATHEPTEVGEVDYVLVCVKTWQLADSAAAMSPLLGPVTAVITTQNGVEAPAQLVQAVGREHVLPGVAKVFTQIAVPGRIRHLGGPGSLTFAEWDSSTSPRVKRLREALITAGVAVDDPADIWTALWAKFLFVAPLGGLGAVCRAPVGVLRAHRETREMLMAAMTEIRDVGLAHGIAFDKDVVNTAIAFVDQQPANGQSSLQRDIAAGKPSELDAWNGAVTRLGRQAGVETPVNTFLYHSLLPQELKARLVPTLNRQRMIRRLSTPAGTWC